MILLIAHPDDPSDPLSTVWDTWDAIHTLHVFLFQLKESSGQTVIHYITYS